MLWLGDDMVDTISYSIAQKALSLLKQDMPKLTDVEINLIKSNFKFNVYAKYPVYSYNNIVIDTLENTTGIDAQNSNYVYDSSIKAITSGWFQTTPINTVIQPRSVLLVVDALGGDAVLLDVDAGAGNWSRIGNMSGLGYIRTGQTFSFQRPVIIRKVQLLLSLGQGTPGDITVKLVAGTNYTGTTLASGIIPAFTDSTAKWYTCILDHDVTLQPNTTYLIYCDVPNVAGNNYRWHGQYDVYADGQGYNMFDGKTWGPTSNDFCLRLIGTLHGSFSANIYNISRDGGLHWQQIEVESHTDAASLPDGHSLVLKTNVNTPVSAYALLWI
jgi:hypothetical protein